MYYRGRLQTCVCRFVCVWIHIHVCLFQIKTNPLLYLVAAWKHIRQKKSPSMYSLTNMLIKGVLYKWLSAVGLCSAEIQFLKVPEAENPWDSIVWQRKSTAPISKTKLRNPSFPSLPHISLTCPTLRSPDCHRKWRHNSPSEHIGKVPHTGDMLRAELNAPCEKINKIIKKRERESRHNGEETVGGLTHLWMKGLKIKHAACQFMFVWALTTNFSELSIMIFSTRWVKEHLNACLNLNSDRQATSAGAYTIGHSSQTNKSGLGCPN